MADAPVQGITIDPNLTVNAFSTGMAAQFNYGAGAQADRTSVIASRNAATTDSLAKTNFLYGQGALSQQSAETQGITAKTAAQLISNDISLYGLNQVKLEQEKVGNYTRENKSLAAQQDLNRQQNVTDYMSSPAGQLGLNKAIQLQAETEVNKAEIGAKTVSNQLGNMDLQQQTEYANLQINNAAVSRQRDAVLNRQRITQQLHEAHQADLTIRDQTGNARPERQIALLDSLAKSDFAAFSDAADVVAPLVAKLDQGFDLPDTLRSSLTDVRNAAAYVTSGTAIKNTMAGLVQARSQGGSSPTGDAILSRAQSIGIDPNNETDVLNMTVEKKDNLYRLIGIDGQPSSPMTEEEFNQSPEMQNLYVQSERRRRSLDNPLTRGDLAQAQLKQISDAAFIPEVGQGFSRLITNLGPEISDVKGFTTRAAGAVKEMQQNLQSFNPFFGPEGAELFEGTNIGENILGRGVNALQGFLGFEDNDRAKLRKKFTNNPELATQVAMAYKNRSTGGMPPAVFQSTVDKIVAQTAASDSRYQVTATNSPAAVAELTKMLRAKVQRNLTIPTNEIVLRQAYELVSEVRPDLAGQDASVQTRGAVSILSGIKRALGGVGATILGADQQDLTRYLEVPTK